MGLLQVVQVQVQVQVEVFERHRAGATCHVQLVHGHGHATTPLSDRSRLIDIESERALQEAHYSYRDHNNDTPAFVRNYILIVILWGARRRTIIL